MKKLIMMVTVAAMLVGCDTTVGMYEKTKELTKEGLITKRANGMKTGAEYFDTLEFYCIELAIECDYSYTWCKINYNGNKPLAEIEWKQCKRNILF